MSKQTITALYDSREYANNAALMLHQKGVANDDVTISPEAAATGYAKDAGPQAKGFWASLDNMFGGTEDHSIYAEGLRRGGILLTAHVDDTKVDDAIDILEQHGSVDLNERETAWRGEGWSGAPVTGGGIASEGAGPLRSMAPVEATLAETATARTVTPAAPVADIRSAVRTGGDDVIQVMEEQLNVGKRAVNRGKVRIHSYVVETPVSESVSLRDETVSIDRRPVDRPLAAADLGVDAFRDRTIEMDEIDEEAVIGKTTRVVEEIGIRKDVADRTQTINDTVRSTKVDIEDGRTVGRTAAFAGEPGIDPVKDMEVLGSDGKHVGVVDHADGGATIKLKRLDPSSGGTHHLIPAEWVQSIDQKVRLKVTAAEAMNRWTAA